MSNSMSPDDTISVHKTRRQGSNASQEPNAGFETPTHKPSSRNGSKPGSPTKRDKTATPTTGPSSYPANGPASRKATPTSLRKPSAPIKTGPVSSANSTSQRPATRSGDPDRPRTAVNRPEGDPPWLATMYKPDPRLPPDQQIIPTHAKRQQQAQWADDGSVPKTYDRDFTPLAVHAPEELAKRNSLTLTSHAVGGSSPIPASNDPSSSMNANNNSWPLKPMASARGNASPSPRPGTSGSTTGGYSTMPKVAPSPILIQQSPRMGGLASPRSANAPPRLQDQRPGEAAEKDDDDGTVKKGCGCCIVM